MYARVLGALVIAAILAACGGGSSGPNATVPLPTNKPTLPPPTLQGVQISADSFTDSLGQHDTEVEPSAVAHGQMIVAAFQVARQLVAGGSAIGFSRSVNGGRSWSSATLPGITKISGGSADSASDAAVAYDAAHGEWLISVVPVLNGTVAYPEVSRSSDAVVWDLPVRVGTGDVNDDKEWIACDNVSSSPHFGHCYVSWDDAGRNGLVETSTSFDGGATWSAPRTSSDAATGIGAQPVPLPNGDLVVVSDDANEANVLAITSHDGGATFGISTLVAQIIDHFQAGTLRSGPLVTTAIDATGRIYALWQDCRFEVNCSADDLVLSTSLDGHQWTTPQRLPLDAIGSGIDHFIPGLGVDSNTGGSGAHLGVAYYTYANTVCSASCTLSLAYAASPDGGKTWTAPTSPGGAMELNWLAQTIEGRMVADYVASVFTVGSPTAVYTQALASTGLLNEATYAWSPSVMLAQARRTGVHDRAIAGAKSDHPMRHFVPAH